MGSVVLWPAPAPPTDWLTCDGASLLRSAYPALFAVLGTTYGAADGTHFTLPDYRGRVPVGLNAGDADFDTLGETSGAKTATPIGPRGHAARRPHRDPARRPREPRGHPALGARGPGPQRARGRRRLLARRCRGRGALVPLARAAVRDQRHARDQLDQRDRPSARARRAPAAGRRRPRASRRTRRGQVAGRRASARTRSRRPSDHTVTQPSAHSDHAAQSHAGAAVDAHSAHSGTAVSAHTGAAVGDHAAISVAPAERRRQLHHQGSLKERPMAQRSRFFDSSGGDRIYTSDAWAQVLGAIIGDGVVATGNELAVAEASPPAMSVRVNTGKAFIGGYYFEVHTGQETLAIAAAHPTLAADRPGRRPPRPRRPDRRPGGPHGHAGRPADRARPHAGGGGRVGDRPRVGRGRAGGSLDRRREHHRRARPAGEGHRHREPLGDAARPDERPSPRGHGWHRPQGPPRRPRGAHDRQPPRQVPHPQRRRVGLGRPRGDDGPDRDRPPPGTRGRPRRQRHGRRGRRGWDGRRRSPARRTATRSPRRARRQPTWRPPGAAGATGALARAGHVHAHGSGYLPDAHHPQVHALNSHTGTADDINAWAQASAGGGAAGVKVWVGTTDPGASAVEGDIWVKK